MERRKINLNSISGLDLRDFNTDTQKAKEIVNLVKDKDGWRIRDGKLDVYENINSFDDVKEFIMHAATNKVCMVIGKSIYIYAVDGDTIGTLLEKYTFTYDFKLYGTNYPLVYFMIDTTNHKSYVLEFTDRNVVIINDTGSLEAPLSSTELLLHEYDVNTGDLTWAALAKHNPYDLASHVTGPHVHIKNGNTYIQTVSGGFTSCLSIGYEVNVCSQILSVSGIVNSNCFTVNSAVTGTNTNTLMSYARSLNGKIYNSSMNRYMINWDSNFIDSATEWHELALIPQTDNESGKSRYIALAGKGAETHAYLFDYDDTTPEMWTTHKVHTSKNIFKVDGTGAINDKARFCDTIGGAYTPAYNTLTWPALQGSESALDRLVNVYSINYFSDTNVWFSGKSAFLGRVVRWDGSQYITEFASGDPIKVLDYVNATCYLVVELSNTPLKDQYLYKATGINTYEFYTAQDYFEFDTYRPTGAKFVSDTDIYIATDKGFWNFNGSAYNASVTWTNLSSGLSTGGMNMRDMHYVAGDNIYAVTANAAYRYNGTAWTNVNTGLSGAQLNMLCFEFVDGSTFYAGTDGGGIVKWDGSTWADFSTGLTAGIKIHDIDYVNASYIMAATNVGVFVSDGSIWTQHTTGLGVNCVSYGSTYKQYTGSNGGGVYDTTYNFYQADYKFDTFIPNADALAKLNYDGTDLIYTASNIALTGKECQACKIIDTTYSDASRFNYAVLSNQEGGSSAIEIYLITKSGDGTYRESHTNGTCVFSSIALANTLARWTYTNFIGMTVVANKYYELNDPALKGFTVIACYTDNGYTRFDNIDFVLGNNAYNALTYYSRNIGSGIDSNSAGYLTTQSHIWTTRIASISSDGQSHNVYADKGMTVITYPISGNQMTNVDVTNILATYNSDISRYCDYEGMVMGGFVSNPQGYVLTEINRSKKAPVRPYFTPDDDDVIFSTTSANNYELHCMYEMTTTDGSAFKTPVDIDSGSQVLMNDDSNVNCQKYWMFYLLDSGLLDDTIPYINLAKGYKNPVTNAYTLKFWQQDNTFLTDVYKSVSEEQATALPYRFYNNNLDLNNDDAYVKYSKIFYNHSDTTVRNMFNVGSYYETSKTVLFEIQDLVLTSNELLLALDYYNKVLYYGYGFKYLNLLNNNKLKSNATAIQEIGNSTFALTCENDLYMGMALGEDSFSLSYIASNLGLEKDNYKSLVSNGNQAYFMNRKGVYMIYSNAMNSVARISDPIDQYLQRSATGQVLGIDGNDGQLLIPIDTTKMSNLQAQFYSGDYTYTTDTNVNYNKAFAVYDYNNAVWLMYAYQDDQNGYADFMANFKDHLLTRVGSKLIIPSYHEADGTENPIGRFTTKRASFGNVQALKKLYDLQFYLINNVDSNGNKYGIDYMKIYVMLNKKVPVVRKYGDFDILRSYSDVNTVNHVTSIESINIPMGYDFNDVEVTVEFARFSDTNTCITTLNEIDVDVIQKNLEKFGVR